jgi:hypothetical protein
MTQILLCVKMEGVWLYHHRELKYKGSFWEIKKQYEYPIAKFQNLKNNSGIITIPFKGNCKGETGDFSLQQCDLACQLTRLDTAITTYFLNKTKMLKGWSPAKNKEGKLINSHKFYSLRIRQGILLEILPK